MPVQQVDLIQRVQLQGMVQDDPEELKARNRVSAVEPWEKWWKAG